MSMITPRTLLLCIALALAGCAERAVSSLDRGGNPPPDQGAIPDGHIRLDHGGLIPDLPVARPDRAPPPDRGIGPGFCAGSQPRVEVNGQALQVGTLSTYINVMASCCGPGEVLEFQSFNAAGLNASVLFYMVRFPGLTLPPQIKLDLAKPPSGWAFGVQCSAGSGCSGAHPASSRFSGTWEMRSLLGGPAVEVTLCADIRPGAGSGGGKDRIRLYSPRVVVNTACVPGMDQTCNADPMISSLKGKCLPNSTCTCNPGAVKMANGKCK